MGKPNKPPEQQPETPAAPPAELKVKVRYCNGAYESYFAGLGQHLKIGEVIEVTPQMAETLVGGSQFERYEEPKPEPVASSEKPS